MNTKQKTGFMLTLAFGVSCTTLASANTWQLTYELPGVQTSSATFVASGVEPFDSRSLGTAQGFTSTFGGSSFTGNYSGIQITSADQFGGSGGVGRYATISASSYTVALNSSVNYFGYWQSSLDPGNVLTFYDGATIVGQFNVNTVFLAAIASKPNYFGNPNGQFLGLDNGEAFVFVNFYSTGIGDKFDKIVFTETTAGGFESDNQTVGIYATIGGISVLPEPASTALFLVGLYTIGLFSRRKFMQPK